MAHVVLSLGSNMGDRSKYLEKALLLCQKQIGKVGRISNVYETEPWGDKEQNKFLNQVFEIESALEPQDVLEKILAIEVSLGRDRTRGKWKARTLDIDILFYDELIVNTKSLTIPHPEIENRRFILEPLNEICPEFIHPSRGFSITQLLKYCKDKLTVKISTVEV